MTISEQPAQVGPLLRAWRDRRRLSQLALANQAGISARHVSFLETGRSQPSRDMVLRLAEELDVPLRERNDVLLAAGYAPVYEERPLSDPMRGPVREAIEQVLKGHNPYPALVLDSGWNIIDSNSSFAIFTEGAAPELLEPPVNTLRLVLHPEGLAPRILNLGVWRAKLLHRLRRQVATDAALRPFYEELLGYPCHQAEPDVDLPGAGDFCMPLQLRHGDEELSFFSTYATFGTPRDITVAELIIESFFPADPPTASVLQRMYAG